MKNFFKLIIFTTLFLNSYFCNAENILITGIVDGDSIGLNQVGKIIFPDSSSGVYVKTDNYKSDKNSDLYIYGNFLIGSLYDKNDEKLGLVTFDHGVSSVPKVVLKNNKDGKTFTFSGYARSNAVGWIYFGETGEKNGKVIYNKITQKITGNAWNENIGWIPMDLNLDITPPNIDKILKPIQADNNHLFNLDEKLTIKIDNYDSISKEIYQNVSSFSHDVRKAKIYNIEAFDLAGNISTGQINVVSGLPIEQLTDKLDGVNYFSKFNSSLDSIKIGDGKDFHSLNFNLKDIYGNDILTVPGIKKISIKLSLNNNIDTNQILNLDFGDSIKFFNNDFLGLIGGIGYTESEIIGKTNFSSYNLNFSSLAPSKEGYFYTNKNNDISVDKFIVSIISLTNSGNIESGNFDYSSKYNGNFKFSPVVKISDFKSNSLLSGSIENEISFTGKILINKTKGSPSISFLKSNYFIDVLDSSRGLNINLYHNFQNIKSLNNVCVGFIRKNKLGIGFLYDGEGTLCDNQIKNYSSNILINHSGPFYKNNYELFDSFKATPKKIINLDNSFSFKYSSEISYILNSKQISYPSYFILNN